jgi:hypothetical protein
MKTTVSVTCRSLLEREYPKKVGDSWVGGCSGCPHHYGYETNPSWCKGKKAENYSEEACKRCWDRKIELPVAYTDYVNHDVSITKQLCNMVYGYQHGIKKVIFNNPATIVLWCDGTKTVVKCQDGDVYDPEKGLAMAISKKALGNKGNFNEVFKKWLPDEECLYPKLVAPRGMNSGLADAMITAFERMISNKEVNGNVEG